MRKYLLGAFAAGLAFIVGAVIAANLPFITPQSGGSDPIGAINGLIGQLSGGPGYTGTPQLVSIGPVCSASSSASPTTCNGQSGNVNTTTLTLAAGATQTYQINNSFASQFGICVSQIVFYSGTFGTNGIPMLTGFSQNPGIMSLQIANVGANALNGAVAISFICTR